MTVNMAGESEDRPVPVSATSISKSDRATPRNHNTLDRIQEAAQRKRVQNRIAQRSYRERMKKRIEALEQFRDASAESPQQTTACDMRPINFNETHKRRRTDSQSISPAVVTTPSSLNPGCLQAKCASLCCPSSTTPSEEIQSTNPPHQPVLEPLPTMLTPPRDATLFFEQFVQADEYDIPDDQSDSSVWELGDAIGIKNDVTDLNQQPDVEGYPTSKWPNHEFSESVSTLSEDIMGANKQYPPPYSCKTIAQANLLDDSHDGKTALHIAAETGQQSSVQLLMSLQPDVLARDQLDRTALHLAVYNKHEGVIQELLKKPSNLELQDLGGQTALHTAVASGQERAVEYLLAAGADPEFKDPAGRRALHLAALKGYDKILQLLLENGADINSKISQ